jgi:hypothetical protein
MIVELGKVSEETKGMLQKDFETVPPFPKDPLI